MSANSGEDSAGPAASAAASEGQQIAPGLTTSFGLPKIIKELGDSWLWPQAEADDDAFDGIFPLNLAPPAAPGAAGGSAMGSAGTGGASAGHSAPSANNGGAPFARDSAPGIPASNAFSAQGGGGSASAGVSAETATAAAAAIAADPGAAAGSDKGTGAAAGKHPKEHSSGGGIGDAWTGGAQLAGCGGFDPVVNWNDGLTLNTGAIEYQSEGDSVDLRSQVAGKEVASYAWDTSQAPTATQVSATNTYKLTLRWGNIYSGNYVDNRIRLTVNYTDQTQEVLDYNFRVINDGTAPMGSGGGSPVSATWPEVVAPDKYAPVREAVGGDRYGLDKATGELNALHVLPSYGSAGVHLALRYNSEAAAPKPIFLDRYELNPSLGIPETVSAKLTFDDTEYQEYYYDTSAVNPGTVLQIALQGDARTLSTGRYSWRIDVVAHYTGGDVSSYNTGTVSILNRSSSPIGAGWQFDGLQRLHSFDNGALVDLGGNESLWFAWDAQTQTYTTPADDFSSLVKNGDNTFTRTLKTGEEINFDTAGKEASFVDRNDNTTSFEYDGSGRLITITDPNGLSTDLAYTDGLLATITDPADRVTSFTNTSGRITAITEPNSTSWEFTYDTDGRMTERTDPNSNVTAFNYAFGRISGVDRADSTSDSLQPYQIQGLLASGQGTSESPGAAVLLAEAAATYTDGRSNAWQTEMDWHGFGSPVRRIDPESQLAVTHRDANGLPWLDTDTLGRNVEMFRDSKGNVTSQIRPDYTAESWTYNSFSLPTQYTDPGNKVYAYSYDSDGNLTQITYPNSETRSYTYTDDGLVATATDQMGRVTKYDYDTADQLIEIILPDGTSGTDEDNPRQLFEYDVYGNRTSFTDELGRVTTYAYNVMNWMTSEVLPDLTPNDPDDNPVWTFAYDDRGNRTSVTDPLEHVTETTYDALGRPLTRTDPLTHEVVYVFDAEGNRTSVTDPLSHSTTAAYDTLGRPTSVTTPLENTSTTTYDAASQVTARSDPLENETSMSYTATAKLASLSNPEGGGFANGYTSQGWLNAQAASGGGTTSYTYNDLGWKTAITDPLSHTTSLAYNDAGYVTSRTNPLSKTTSYAYDERNRMTSVTDPLDHETSFEYDAAGNVTSSTDALSRTTSYEYDAQDRVTAITDARDFSTEIAYDLAGRLTSVTDAVNNVTTFGYDAADRLTSRTDPLDNATSYVYDAANRLTSVTDRNGREIAYTYDNDNRLTAEDWLDGQGQPIRTITFEYDDAGRLTDISDTDATYAFAYDGNGRLTSVDNTGTSGVPQVTLTYTYDTRDNRTQLSDNRSGSIAYTYDNANRMTRAELAVTGVNAKARVDFGYDNADRMTSLTRTNPLASGGSGGSGGGAATVSTALTFDDADRMTGISHTAGQTSLASYSLTWDAANQLTQEVSNDGTVNYGYDSGGQLTSASGWRSESYSYDGTGNRTMTGYQTGTGNRLTSDGTFNYTYDDNGNLLTKTEISTSKVTEYTWDYRNRLTDVKQKDSGGNVIQEQQYRYDPLDRRIAVGNDPDGAGQQPTTWQYTVYDGINPYADFDNSGSLTNRYLYGPAVDQVLARFSAAGTIGWYLSDQLGSVRDIANQAGTVLDHIKYDSFGQVVSESSPGNGDRFKFTAREYDPNTGQYYYRARYYEPAIGRFTAEDPKGLAAGDTNTFRYVGNDPIRRTDPLGLDPLLTSGIWHAQRYAEEMAREHARIEEINRRIQERRDREYREMMDRMRRGVYPTPQSTPPGPGVGPYTPPPDWYLRMQRELAEYEAAMRRRVGFPPPGAMSGARQLEESGRIRSGGMPTTVPHPVDGEPPTRVQPPRGFSGGGPF